jgi:peptidoglycan/xylan/chitin deacetylase (PgdA/CDA1 family)
MMKRVIKLVLSTLVWMTDQGRAWLLRLTGRKPAGRGVILYYHGVRAEETGMFDRQMEQLLRCARPIAADWQGPLEPGTLSVAVTFDDAFLSVAENAWPAMERRRIPATIFVPTGYLGQVPGWLTNPRSKAGKEIVMTPEQLRELGRKPLMTLGSHTVFHRRMDRLGEADARVDLFESKSQLEAVLGRTVDTFSFPHGAYTPRVLELAREAGYRVVYGISPTCSEGEYGGFLLGRVAVEPDDWAWEFRLKMAGAYRWMARA